MIAGKGELPSLPGPYSEVSVPPTSLSCVPSPSLLCPGEGGVSPRVHVTSLASDAYRRLLVSKTAKGFCAIIILFLFKTLGIFYCCQ